MRGVPSLTIFVRIEENLIMNLRAASPRHLEAEADLDAFHRLNAHQRLRQPAVELAIPLRVRAQTRRQSQSDDFEDTAQSVAFFLTLFDQERSSFLRLRYRPCAPATLPSARKFRRK